ncbi:MAG: hypothetical protein PHO41_01860 [Eubacteriales bacterium]|nr:hypothetical protein [Eubacteriales bacterium]
MEYCEKCKMLCTDGVCPGCGKKKLRQAEETDYCFLTEKGVMWAEMLMEVLQDNAVPCVKQSRVGAGLSLYTGQSWERYKVFVPYRYLEQAKGLMEELFSADAEQETEQQ